MYARLTFHTADPARLSEVINHYESVVRMDFSHQQGSRGMSVAVNDDVGVALVEAYWASEDAMRTNDASFTRPIHDAAFFGATVSTEHYEVARFVHVAAPSPGAAVTLTRIDIDGTGLDEVLAAYGDATGPLARCDGFCSAVLLVDRENGRAIVESVWRDREAQVAALGPAAQRRVEAVSGGNVTVRGIDQYRLDFHAVELA